MEVADRVTGMLNVPAFSPTVSLVLAKETAGGAGSVSMMVPVAVRGAFSSTDTVLSPELATTRSGVPTPLSTVTATGDLSAAKLC